MVVIVLFHKNEHKKELKRMDVKRLQEHLRDLEKEKMRLTTHAHTKDGSSGQVRNYPVVSGGDFRGNLKRLNKDIARVKTFLLSKMRG